MWSETERKLYLQYSNQLYGFFYQTGWPWRPRFSSSLNSFHSPQHSCCHSYYLPVLNQALVMPKHSGIILYRRVQYSIVRGPFTSALSTRARFPRLRVRIVVRCDNRVENKKRIKEEHKRRQANPFTGEGRTDKRWAWADEVKPGETMCYVEIGASVSHVIWSYQVRCGIWAMPCFSPRPVFPPLLETAEDDRQFQAHEYFRLSNFFRVRQLEALLKYFEYTAGGVCSARTRMKKTRDG